MTDTNHPEVPAFNGSASTGHPEEMATSKAQADSLCMKEYYGKLVQCHKEMQDEEMEQNHLTEEHATKPATDEDQRQKTNSSQGQTGLNEGQNEHMTKPALDEGQRQKETNCSQGQTGLNDEGQDKHQSDDCQVGDSQGHIEVAECETSPSESSEEQGQLQYSKGPNDQTQVELDEGQDHSKPTEAQNQAVSDGQELCNEVQDQSESNEVQSQTITKEGQPDLSAVQPESESTAEVQGQSEPKSADLTDDTQDTISSIMISLVASIEASSDPLNVTVQQPEMANHGPQDIIPTNENNPDNIIPTNEITSCLQNEDQPTGQSTEKASTCTAQSQETSKQSQKQTTGIQSIQVVTTKIVHSENEPPSGNDKSLDNVAVKSENLEFEVHGVIDVVPGITHAVEVAEHTTSSTANAVDDDAFPATSTVVAVPKKMKRGRKSKKSAGSVAPKKAPIRKLAKRGLQNSIPRAEKNAGYNGKGNALLPGTIVLSMAPDNSSSVPSDSPMRNGLTAPNAVQSQEHQELVQKLKDQVSFIDGKYFCIPS